MDSAKIGDHLDIIIHINSLQDPGAKFQNTQVNLPRWSGGKCSTSNLHCWQIGPEVPFGMCDNHSFREGASPPTVARKASIDNFHRYVIRTRGGKSAHYMQLQLSAFEQQDDGGKASSFTGSRCLQNWMKAPGFVARYARHVFMRL